jgi:hypothetical protein
MPHMLRALITRSLLVVSFVLFPLLARPQSFVPPSSCPCTLRGSVVNVVSGQPVGHALVRLSGDPRATFTDSEGKFQFNGLPAGSFTLLAEKPGFLGFDWGGSPSPVLASINLAPDSPDAVVKLTPESVVFGQVLDEKGEPLEGFTVALFSRNPTNGGLFSAPHQRFVTDDQGKFRIAGVFPGSYYLAVRAEQQPALRSSQKSAAPMGFAPAFYPGVSGPSAAVRLKLRAGGTVQANFSLKREPFVQLSGTVTGYAPKDQVTLALQDSSGASEASDVIFDSATGSFHTKWIPPGVYNLSAQSAGLYDLGKGTLRRVLVDVQSSEVDQAGASSRPAYASLHVNANSSLSSLRLVLQPTVDIPIVIRNLPAANSEGPPSVPFSLALVSKDDELMGFNRSVSAENSSRPESSGDVRMIFSGVVPGTYELAVESPSEAEVYTESAFWGSTDLLHNDLVLDSSGSIPPIEIAVRDDGAALNGAVSFSDLPVPAQVVLLGENRRRPRIVPAAPSGDFEVSGLAPGVYRVFAVDASAGYDYTDPGFLQKISSKIQEVTLAPKQSASISLELVTEEE